MNSDFKLFINSDLSSIFKKVDDLNLYTQNQISESYINLIVEAESFLLRQTIIKLEDDFDQSAVTKFLTADEDYLDMRELSRTESKNKLLNYLISNNFDFIITSTGLAYAILSYPELNQNISSKLSRQIHNYGSILNKIDCFNDPRFEDDILICGKRKDFIYNFYFERFRIYEEDSSYKVDCRYFLDSVINLEGFKKVYYITENKKEYLNYFRKSSIDKLLD
jgi:hypothetical protein